MIGERRVRVEKGIECRGGLKYYKGVHGGREDGVTSLTILDLL